MLPGLVYVVRDGWNEELRYSLRTVTRNLPHSSVAVFGGLPDWGNRATIHHVPIPGRPGDPLGSSQGNLRAALDDPAVPDRFLLLNDDHFTLSPMPAGVGVHHRGPIQEVIDTFLARWNGNEGSYVGEQRDTLAVLEAHGWSTLSYELHVPFWVDKALARETFEVMDAATPRWGVQFRSLYGNMHQIGGTRIEDVKVYDLIGAPTSGIVSTSDYSFTSGSIGDRIREQFPHRSPYENPPTWVGTPKKGERVYKYENPTSGQVILTDELRPDLDAVARWTRTETDEFEVTETPDPSLPPVVPTVEGAVDNPSGVPADVQAQVDAETAANAADEQPTASEPPTGEAPSEAVPSEPAATEPVQVVGEPVPEGTVITPENAGIVTDAAGVEHVGVLPAEAATEPAAPEEGQPAG